MLTGPRAGYMSDEAAVTASDGPATVERSVTVKGEGVIVELSIATDAPATVRVTDDLPAAVGPDQVGFHPDHTPETGEATADCVAFEVDVAPEAPLTVVYGAYLDTTGLDVDWEAPALRLDTEAIAAAPTSDGGSDDSGLRGAVSRFLGGGNDEEPDTPARSESSGIEELEEFDESAVDDADPEPAIVESDDDLDLADPTDEADDENEDENEDVDAGPLEPAIRKLEADDDDEETADATEDADDTENVDALDEGADTDAPDEADSDPDVVADDEADDEAATSAAIGDGGSSVAAALAAELEAGEVDEDTRETLAEELGATLSGSQTARLDHVQRRVDDLSAYVTPLEELLDQEGRPVDVVADLRTEVAAVREEAAALDDGLEEAESATAEVRESVDDLGERLDEAVETAETEREALEADLDDVADEVAAAREELDAELAAMRETLTEELERVEADAREGRADIEADVDDLETVAAQVRSMREALSSAFGMDTAVEDPVDEEEDDSEAEPSAEVDVNDDEEAEQTAEQVADGGDSTDIESRLREMESDEDDADREREKPF